MDFVIKAYCIDYASALLGVLSAIFWGWSAKVAIPTGYDTDEDQKKAFTKIGWLNCAAAALAALTAAAQGAKIFGGIKGFVV